MTNDFDQLLGDLTEITKQLEGWPGAVKTVMKAVQMLREQRKRLGVYERQEMATEWQRRRGP